MISVIRHSFVNGTKYFSKFKNIKLYSNQTNTTHRLGDIISLTSKRTVGIWLAGMSGMTVGAIMLGGITRLTESGLSMTNWHLFGERPPFSEQEWIKEFDRYKQFPEYQYVVSERGGMSLAQFKLIWCMEYGHRMWGRCLGAAFAIPAAVFYYKGYFNRAMSIRVLIFGGLIGSQGLLGWYMVKSGLEHSESASVPRVSQYRLAAHLGSAIALYSLFMWNSMSLLRSPVKIAEFAQLKMIRGMTHGVKFMVVLTALSGAIVAGLDAGLTYNTWPRMAGQWVPSDLLALRPAWLNIFENATTAQFDHRWLGQLTVVTVLSLTALCHLHRAHLPSSVLMAAHTLALVALSQAALGVATLVHFVPTTLAAVHQTGSIGLLSAALWLSHGLRRLPK